MTSRSYFGKMNSTLGYVVPLAMFQLTLAMGTALMESRCFLGFRLLSTNITIRGKVVGKVFALNVTLNATATLLEWLKLPQRHL